MDKLESLENYAATELCVIATLANELAGILNYVTDEGTTITLPRRGETLSSASDKISYVIDELHDLKKKALDAELLLEVAKELED